MKYRAAKDQYELLMADWALALLLKEEADKQLSSVTRKLKNRYPSEWKELEKQPRKTKPNEIEKYQGLIPSALWATFQESPIEALRRVQLWKLAALYREDPKEEWIEQWAELEWMKRNERD